MRTYRIRKVPNARGTPTRGRGPATHLEVLDEDSTLVMATCSFSGRACLTTLEIVAADGAMWTVKPGRRIMPTSWTVVSDVREVIGLQVRFWRSFFNPLARAAVVVRGSSGEELFRVSDARTGKADRLLGSGPIEWLFMRGNESIGKLRPLQRRAPEKAGPIRRLLSGADYDIGIVSAGDEHVLAAPAALALAAIHSELTDVS